jgi:hypothetical protein
VGWFGWLLDIRLEGFVMRRFVFGLLFFALAGCGNERQLVESGQAVSQPQGARYAPPTVNGEIMIEMAFSWHISPLPVKLNQTLRFMHPPATARGEAWVIEYDPTYLAPAGRKILDRYPPEGWTFTAIQTGTTAIRLLNINQDFTSCDRNFCPEQFDFVLSYRLDIQEKPH